MSTLEILTTTLLGGVLSAFVPLVNAELIILSAATMGPRHLAAPCILLVTLGQMVGKSVIFMAGRGAISIPWLVSAEKLRKASRRIDEGGRTGDLVLFASASAGLPPFYLTSVACGMLRMSFLRFAAVGFTGRLIRFSALAVFPQLAGGVLP